MIIVAGKELLFIVCARGMIICDLRNLPPCDMRALMLTIASIVVCDNLGTQDGSRALGA